MGPVFRVDRFQFGAWFFSIVLSAIRDQIIITRFCFVQGQDSVLYRVQYVQVALYLCCMLGGTVHMVCRNKERGESAQKQIIEESGSQVIIYIYVYASRYAAELFQTFFFHLKLELLMQIQASNDEKYVY